MLEEFVAAENLLEKAGLLNGKLPIPVEAIMEYMAREGLGLRYYNPGQAPGPIKSVASGVDEVLVYQEESALLFVNQSRPLTRQRFSIFHGIGHFLLPGHRGLNYLAQGCTTMEPWTRKPYERQADRFAAGMNCRRAASGTTWRFSPSVCRRSKNWPSGTQLRWRALPSTMLTWPTRPVRWSGWRGSMKSMVSSYQTLSSRCATR